MSKNKRSRKPVRFAHIDVVPAEEFTGVPPNGEENPEWRPGDLKLVKSEDEVDADKSKPESLT